MSDPSLAGLESRLAYTFADRRLLNRALNHSSFVNEQPGAAQADNERLEFLGDAVVNLVVGHLLMARFPDLKEGDLSRMRARLVSESSLAGLAAAVGIGDFIRLGKGELQTNGRQKPSILADAYEAVTAAVYLDGGFRAAFRLIERHFSGMLRLAADIIDNSDPKSRLQEIVQTHNTPPPQYAVVAETGPDHDKRFRVAVRAGQWTAEGTGKSKKGAELEAARRVLAEIGTNPADNP